MSLHYTLMGNSRKGPSTRIYHSQNDQVIGANRERDDEKERLKRSLHGENAHVPECLVWNVDDGRKEEDSSPRSPRKDYMHKRTPRESEFSITNYKPLPRHPELGRARNHLYGEDGPPNLNPKVKPNEGGVAEAMVGWPEHRRMEEELYGGGGVGWEVDFRDGKGTGKADSKPQKPRKQHIEDGDSDVIMDELISHRFLRENEDRLRQLREQQVIDQATAHRNRFNFRDNKASVLRSEAINGSMDSRRPDDPKGLWKMPRFANAAKSRLNDCSECRRHDCYQEDGRGYPMESCRKSCKGNCRDLDHREGQKINPTGASNPHDHRTCGCTHHDHPDHAAGNDSRYQQTSHDHDHDHDHQRNVVFAV